LPIAAAVGGCGCSPPLPNWEVRKLKLLVTGLVCVGIGMLVLVAGR
jgi:hypothetical protein